MESLVQIRETNGKDLGQTLIQARWCDDVVHKMCWSIYEYCKSARLHYMSHVVNTVLEKEAFIQIKWQVISR